MSLSVPPHLIDDSAGKIRSRLIDAVSASRPLPLDIQSLAAYPVQIAYTKPRGLHLVATRDISAGEVILKEAAPAAIVRPEWESEKRFCSGCFAALSSDRVKQWALQDPRNNDSTNELCEECAMSSKVRVLDKRTFWRDVEPESDSEDEDEDEEGDEAADRLSTLKIGDGKPKAQQKQRDEDVLEASEIDDSLFRFFQRVIFNWDAQLQWKFPETVEAEPAKGESLPPVVTSPLHIMLLTSPQKEHEAIEPQITTFVSLLDTHMHVVGLESQKKLLEKLIRTAFHNAHEVADTAAGRSVGMGIYPIASLLNHACSTAANADWAVEAGGSDSGLFVAKARRDVKEGEELRIEYGKFGDNEGVKLPVKQEYIMKT